MRLIESGKPIMATDARKIIKGHSFEKKVRRKGRKTCLSQPIGNRNEITPPKTNGWNPKHEGLKDFFIPCHFGMISQVLGCSFSGGAIPDLPVAYFGGVVALEHTRLASERST